jgi:hypothetical protein
VVAFSCILILYGGINARPINIEIPGGMTLLLLRVGDVPDHGISLQNLNIP